MVFVIGADLVAHLGARALRGAQGRRIEVDGEPFYLLDVALDAPTPGRAELRCSPMAATAYPAPPALSVSLRGARR